MGTIMYNEYHKGKMVELDLKNPLSLSSLTIIPHAFSTFP
jgi:hypothetical protein